MARRSRGVAGLLPLLFLTACSSDRDSGTAPPADDGKTPKATLAAYYYHKDRGQYVKLRPLVTQNSLSLIPPTDGTGMSERAQKARGIAVDHEDMGADAATLYYRTWFSAGTQSLGGRPTVAKLVKQDGLWKVDVKATLQATVAHKKGKTKLGFYDGTQKWWK